MAKKFGLIGAGNMGGAIAQALCKSAGPENVLIFEPNAEKAHALSTGTGCGLAGSAEELAEAADFLLLCVKPRLVETVLKGILPRLRALDESGARRVIVSIAAGVKIASIEAVLAQEALSLPIVRLMPNTPVAVGKGMTVMAPGDGVSDGELRELSEALSAGGELMRLDEKLIDAATPVFSGSPAFTYMYIEALADGGVKAGLPRDAALKLASQAVLGAAAMVLETGKHPGELKDEVCSPGGSTIVGVEQLEKGGFRAAAMQAVFAAYEKTAQLGE